MLPTIALLAGAALPEYTIDGKNIWSVLAGNEQVPHPHEFYFFEYQRHLEAIMTADGRWKLHLPHPYRHVLEARNDSRRGRVITKRIDWTLFDLDADPYETTNVLDQQPELVERLKAKAEARRKEFNLK